MHTVAVQASIVIKRPVAEVWELASDLENDPLWRSEVISMTHITAAPIGVGTRTVERSCVLGQALETTTELTAFEPLRALRAQSIASPTPVLVERTFQALPGGTRFSYSLRADVSKVLIFRLTRPLLAVWYQSRVERYLRTLKQLLETPSAAATLRAAR